MPHARVLVALLIAALAIRLAAIAAGFGNAFDMTSLQVTAEALVSPGRWQLYSDPALDVRIFANAPAMHRWPYPGAYLPVLTAVQWFATTVGGPFSALVRLPPVAADLALATLLYVHHAARHAPAALPAALLVLFGPLFVLVSAYHGQIDVVAMLAVVAAFFCWERMRPGLRRGLCAGALIGLGCAIKTFPIVFVLALLPLVRDRREGLVLLAAAAAVPAITLAPFFLADPHGVIDTLSYRGVSGLGGVSLLVQPGLIEAIFHQDPLPTLSAASRAVTTATAPVLAAALLGAGLWLRSRRLDPWTAGVLIAAIVFVSGLNFAFQYGVWAIVLLLFAGRLKAAAAAQALMLVPAFFAYTAVPIGGYAALPVDLVYAPVMVTAPLVFLWIAIAGLRTRRDPA